MSAASDAPQKARLREPDWWLLAVTIVLVAVGLMMVFSSSAIIADKNYQDTYYFFKRQAQFALLGGVAMAIVAAMPRQLIYNMLYPFLFVVFVLLILTVSPLGVKVNGAQRWLSVGAFRLQSMEFAKIALVLYLGYFMGTKQAIIKSFDKGVIPPFLMTAMMCMMLLVQPDFGGAAILSLLLFFMCLVGGTRAIYLIISAVLATGGAWLLVTKVAYRSRRLLAFRDPFAVANDEGYHLVQSLYAIGSGGFSGMGLGLSRQKLFYLPEPHTDFIVAVLGEETGFLGMSLLFILLAFFFWRGMLIALKQENLQDRFTAFGILLVVQLSVLLNMAVVLSAVPPKGVPMPFLSYGGSSLLGSMICVGLLLNLSRTRKA